MARTGGVRVIHYRDAVPADGPALAAMARRSFTATFGALYRQEDLAAFLEQAFGATGLPTQLDDPAFTVRVALDGDAVAGFAKIGPVAFPGEWPADAVELYQLYVLDQYHGAGIGPTLMDWTLAAARARGAGELVLSVFVDNHRAKRFYQRYGFEEIGRYAFMVGAHEDEDVLMRLAL